jgi:DNA-binding transcriptional ArsR family regulator
MMDTEINSDRNTTTSILTGGSPSDIPTGVDVNTAALVAMALGHRLRMQILSTVVPFRAPGLSAGALSAELIVVPSSLSFHLQQMTKAGVLTVRREGRSIFYSANHDSIAVLCDLLSSFIDQGKTSAPSASDTHGSMATQ